MSNPVNPRGINVQGAVDLAALAQARQSAAASQENRSKAPAGVIVDVSELTFEVEVLARSMQVPVIVDFWAEWCAPCRQLSPILEKLAIEYGGKVVLAKVDADANQQLAQMFQVQSIPSVFLVLAGQAQPLFQSAISEPQARQVFEQVVKVAEQAGLAGETHSGAEAAEVETPIDPRLAAAYDAIEKGEWDTATAAYQALLNQNPGDEEAKAGILQVDLMRRTEDLDLVAVAAAPITSAEDRLKSADALMLLNQPAAAFDRLIDGIRQSAGEERVLFKDRLLELFLVIGDSPEVRSARRELTSALF